MSPDLRIENYAGQGRRIRNRIVNCLIHIGNVEVVLQIFMILFEKLTQEIRIKPVGQRFSKNVHALSIIYDSP